MKQNQPSVGYSKALEQATIVSVANQINSSKPAPVNTQSQAQVTEQLTTEKQNFDAINQKVSEQPIYLTKISLTKILPIRILVIKASPMMPAISNPPTPSIPMITCPPINSKQRH
ncbi:MAG: hypothetical protein U1E98_06725 [Moraxella osloensis]